jgi:hypothetical protein
MVSLFKKHLNKLLGLFLLTFLILVWWFPSVGLILAVIFLLFSLIIASFSVVKKHKQAYLRGEISRIVFVRNLILEILGILLIIMVASVLAQYIAEIATRQIYDDVTKFIAGTLVGLLVGLAVGIFSQRIGKKLFWPFLKQNSNKATV